MQHAALLVEVARLFGQPQRLVQAAHAAGEVGVAAVKRVQRPCFIAAGASFMRQGRSALQQHTVLGRVGLGQLHGGHHTQRLALVRRIAQGFEALRGVGGALCG